MRENLEEGRLRSENNAWIFNFTGREVSDVTAATEADGRIDWPIGGKVIGNEKVLEVVRESLS